MQSYRYVLQMVIEWWFSFLFHVSLFLRFQNLFPAYSSCGVQV